VALKAQPNAKRLAAARAYLNKLEPAICGSGGDKHTFIAALNLVGKFGLFEADALIVLQEWNQRCVPPWTEFELLHKLSSAVAAATSENHGLVPAESHDSGTARKVKQPKTAFQPMVLKRIAGKTPHIINIFTYLIEASPVPVDGLDSAGVLRLLYPKGTSEKVLVFSKMESQGQFVWTADSGDAIENHELPSGPDGVWFLPQPVTGEYHANPRMDGKKSRRSQEAVTAWRYAVLESDDANPDDWLRCLIQLPLCIASVCESGRRSIHALVRIDAASKSDWDEKIALIKPTLVTLGADPGALTAVRLTRLPQALRGERRQRLLYLNPNPKGTPILGANAKGVL